MFGNMTSEKRSPDKSIDWIIWVLIQRSVPGMQSAVSNFVLTGFNFHIKETELTTLFSKFQVFNIITEARNLHYPKTTIPLLRVISKSQQLNQDKTPLSTAVSMERIQERDHWW